MLQTNKSIGYLLICLMIIYLYGCHKITLPNYNNGNECDFQLYLALGGLSEKSTKLSNLNKAKRVTLIEMSNINRTNIAKVDEGYINTILDRILPNKFEDGIIAIDWEGPFYEELINSDDSTTQFTEVLNQFKRVLQLVKKNRPKSQVGYYNLPARSYWKRDARWIYNAEKLKPLFIEMDIIFPDIYDFYPDDTPSAGFESDQSYVKDNVLLALRFGNMFNKPVLPFIWHRWHDSNQKDGLKLIPLNEFSAHINRALSVEFKGSRIKGLVWWGSDQYYYNIKSKSLIEELKKYSSFEEYQDQISNKYLKTIYSSFENVCKKINTKI